MEMFDLLHRGVRMTGAGWCDGIAMAIGGVGWREF